MWKLEFNLIDPHNFPEVVFPWSGELGDFNFKKLQLSMNVKWNKQFALIFFKKRLHLASYKFRNKEEDIFFGNFSMAD